MKRSILFAAALASLNMSTASAYRPEPGLWFDTARPGTGYTIDVQDRSIGVVASSFDRLGMPVWYMSAGALTSTVNDSGNIVFNRYTGYFDRYANGSSPGEPWRAPERVAGAGGAVTLVFDPIDEGRAQITWEGVTRTIRHVDVQRGDGTTSSMLNRLLGRWALTIVRPEEGSPFGASGDVLVFDRVDKTTQPAVARGCRLQSVNEHGRCRLSATEQITARYETSTDFYMLDVTRTLAKQQHSNQTMTYFLVAGVDRMRGAVSITADTSGFYQFFGTRIQGGSDVAEVVIQTP